MKLVHWPLWVGCYIGTAMKGLGGGAGAGAQSPYCCTNVTAHPLTASPPMLLIIVPNNSPPINGQCTNNRIAV